jgi:RNA polymerase sigma-70 factor, ECF subfamily
MTGNDADAADAAQDALVAIVRGLPRFDGRAAFTTWAYRIAANACLDELRRRKRRPDPGLPEVEHQPTDHAPLTDQSVSDRLDLDAALAALPHDYRVAVTLRDQLGLEYAEIAAVLKIPVGTVRSRLARGRAALATSLGGERVTPRNRLRPANVEEPSP